MSEPTSPARRRDSGASQLLGVVEDRSFRRRGELSLGAIAEERARGSSPESSTTRLDGGDDLVDVVADDAEANVLGELLDDCAPRWKGVSAHRRSWQKEGTPRRRAD
jgi:hypothetical protein